MRAGEEEGTNISRASEELPKSFQSRQRRQEVLGSAGRLGMPGQMWKRLERWPLVSLKDHWWGRVVLVLGLVQILQNAFVVKAMVDLTQ